ncbi:hypothetical protein ACFFLS_18615 [Flavobacterium procerum]|uniref:Uncharacterized protein n=1 Tax=Flavobacterium procerum TaxID=1455569 RepID=A0ABV6BWK1_9FLAO
MEDKVREGIFEVIESFAIRNRNEFYLIGKMKEGIVKENWFLNVPFNPSLALTLRIKSIEEVEFSSERKNYTLIVIEADSELTDFLLDFNIGSECLDVTIEGED